MNKISNVVHFILHFKHFQRPLHFSLANHNKHGLYAVILDYMHTHLHITKTINYYNGRAEITPRLNIEATLFNW